MEAHPAVFSFTFGVPPPELLNLARRLDVLCIGAATTVEEARHLTDAGVDAIVAQGAEAGAHRGTFLGEFEKATVPTLDLARGIEAYGRTPAIAAGGLMAGRRIAATLPAAPS